MRYVSAIAFNKHGDKKCSLAVGDVVIIKSSERNRNSWPLGIVERLIEGRDGAVRAARLRIGRSQIQLPIQHLYPLESRATGMTEETRRRTTLEQRRLDPDGMHQSPPGSECET